MRVMETPKRTTGSMQSNEVIVFQPNSQYGVLHHLFPTCTIDIITTSKREICINCDRPKPATCICSALPQVKLKLQYTYCIILQHPNESKQHQNRTLPFIEHCIDSNSYLKIIGRRFPSLSNGDSQQSSKIPSDLAYQNEVRRKSYDNEDCPMSYVQCMKSIMQQQQQQTRTTTIWLLSSNDSDNTSVTLSDALQEWEEQKRQHEDNNNDAMMTDTNSKPHPKIILLALDATWKYANEMDRANIQHHCYPHRNCMQRVRLTSDDFHHPLFQKQQQQQQQQRKMCSGDNERNLKTNSDVASLHRFAIRAPPKSKSMADRKDDQINLVYLSTAECLAYVLARIEGNDNIYHTVMKPLDLMVHQWRSHYNTSPTR